MIAFSGLPDGCVMARAFTAALGASALLLASGAQAADRPVGPPWLKKSMTFEQARAELIRRGFTPLRLYHKSVYNCYQWCMYPEVDDCTGGGILACNMIYMDGSFRIYQLGVAGDELKYMGFGPAEPDQAAEYWAMAGL